MREIEAQVRKAWTEALPEGHVPETFGSGESAAKQLATYAAGKADIPLARLAKVA